MALNRRDFLKLGGAGVALGAASPLVSNPFFSRSLQAAMLGTPAKKMIVFFLRGGMDGANVLIPSGDPDYNDTVDSRPTLYIAPEDAIDLSPGFSNTFAHLAPELQKMIDDVPSTDLALIHRVAYTGQSRSHFNSQQYWENAIPGSLAEEGWVNRLIQTETDLDALNLPAASVSFSFQANFRGPRALAHIPNLDIYNIGDEDYDLKLLGAAPNNDSGSGLLASFSSSAALTVFRMLSGSQQTQNMTPTQMSRLLVLRMRWMSCSIRSTMTCALLAELAASWPRFCCMRNRSWLRIW